jgi:hypothetical protein
LNPRKKQPPIKKSSINMVKLLADNECIKKSYIGVAQRIHRVQGGLFKLSATQFYLRGFECKCVSADRMQ